MAAKYVGMGSTPDRGMRELQENIRILQDEVTRLSGLVSTSSQTAAPQAVKGNNFLERDFDRLRFEYDRHDHPSDPVVETSYLSVSYDADDEEFTITVTDLPVNSIDYIEATGTYPDISDAKYFTLSETFVFDKPGSDLTFSLFIHESRTSPLLTPELYWNGGLTASDTATQALYDYGGRGISIANMTLKTDGSHTTSYSYARDAQLVTRALTLRHILYVDTAAKEIILHQFYDSLNNQYNNATYSYTEPVDDDVILGWSNGDITQTLDLSAASYQKELRVGKVKITAGNVVEQCDFYQPGLSFCGLFGYSGTATSSDTVVFRNGQAISKS